MARRLVATVGLLAVFASIVWLPLGAGEKAPTPDVVFKGHTDAVYAVAYSPDGRYVATGSEDMTAQVWDAATRHPVGRPLQHHGTVYAVGGEGSPQWWFAPETYSGWGSNVVFGDENVVAAKPEPVLPEGVTEIPPTSQSDDSKYHMDDWVRGMRTRTPCNGSIETGFAHSVAVVMAARSYREGKKMFWDREHEEITNRS